MRASVARVLLLQVSSVACALLLQTLFAAARKYVYIDTHMTWNDARKYCQDHHIELAMAHSGYDMYQMYLAGAERLKHVWIGLTKRSGEWRWSADAPVGHKPWANSHPKGHLHAVMFNYTWLTRSQLESHPFVCINVTVVREEKTWEQALEHCRSHYWDLASVIYPVEMRMIESELVGVSNEAVWSGMRFHFGRWFWVDGRGVHFQRWRADCNLTAAADPGGDPTCSKTDLECPGLERCGGFRKKATSYNVSGSEPVEWEWEAYDCTRQFYFVCY